MWEQNTKAQTEMQLINDMKHVKKYLCQYQDENQGVGLLLSSKRKLMLTTLKCLIPFVSGLVKKDLCIFAVMGHAHPDTGEDQVRGLRKVNLSV